MRWVNEVLEVFFRHAEKNNDAWSTLGPLVLLIIAAAVLTGAVQLAGGREGD